MAQTMIIRNLTWLLSLNQWIAKHGKQTLKDRYPLMVAAQDDIQFLKPEEDWSKEDDEEAHGNSQAYNSIFNGVDKTSLDSSIHVLLSKKLGRHPRLFMKAPQKFTCLDSNFSLQV